MTAIVVKERLLPENLRRNGLRAYFFLRCKSTDYKTKVSYVTHERMVRCQDLPEKRSLPS